MRRFTYFSLLTALGILLTACGVMAAEAQPAVQLEAQNPAPISTEQAPVPVTGGKEGEVVIAIGDNTIDSSQTTFKAGESYTFVITNYGTVPHTFNINEPVTTKAIFKGYMGSTLLSVLKEQLGPGRTVKVEFTFPANAYNKQWEFSCLIRNHYEDGMRWAIMVTK